jgi:UDP-glucose 4-epimerase
MFKIKDKTSLEKGITSMAGWVKQHGARESSIFNDIEVAKNMPKS